MPNLNNITAYDAIKSAVYGARNYRRGKYKNFKADMNVYGFYDIDGGVCYGCLATLALQDFCGFEFKGSDIGNVWGRSIEAGVDASALQAFERAVDRLRLGHMSGFLRYFGLIAKGEYITSPVFDKKLNLHNVRKLENWAEKNKEYLSSGVLHD